MPKILAALALLCLLAAHAHAATVYVSQKGYRLDNGLKSDNPWTIMEEVVYHKDVAIVVMDKKAKQSKVEALLETFEKMNVPTIFTTRDDYDAFVERGVLIPTTLPKR